MYCKLVSNIHTIGQVRQVPYLPYYYIGRWVGTYVRQATDLERKKESMLCYGLSLCHTYLNEMSKSIKPWYVGRQIRQVLPTTYQVGRYGRLLGRQVGTYLPYLSPELISSSLVRDTYLVRGNAPLPNASHLQRQVGTQLVRYLASAGAEIGRQVSLPTLPTYYLGTYLPTQLTKL